MDYFFVGAFNCLRESLSIEYIFIAQTYNVLIRLMKG